jgi:hypothetical protein
MRTRWRKKAKKSKLCVEGWRHNTVIKRHSLKALEDGFWKACWMKR